LPSSNDARPDADEKVATDRIKAKISLLHELPLDASLLDTGAYMFFLALAADYDGTIAHNGAVDEKTCNSLNRLKQTGRRLVLVTGRELVELKHAFPALGVFDRVVAENGAVIYDPTSGRETVLAPPPPPNLVEKLMARNVEPISVGYCVVATWEPHQLAILETIKELGLELQMVFNKGALMILPPGITKASGLKVALTDLDVSARNIVGVGDAENDHAFLQACGCAAAVANALPPIKANADLTLAGDHGLGVAELIQRIIEDDKGLVFARRLGLPIGTDREGHRVYFMPHQNILVIGDSGCGKSRFAKMLTERMVEKEFEFCIIDPEGDYYGLEHSVAIADGSTVPRTEEALRLLRETGVNVVVNTVALSLAERQRLVSETLVPISELKARTGRPHWIIVDEAHQLFPAGPGASLKLPDVFPASIFNTASPERISNNILKKIDVVVAFGKASFDKLRCLRDSLGLSGRLQDVELRDNEAVIWFRNRDSTVIPVDIDSPRQFHRRHIGKYAVGDVGEWHSFYFRGPHNRMNLRAKNVCEFVHISTQLDDDIWEHHLRAHDYSAWFRNVVKDEELACQAEQIERDSTLKPHESRALLSRMILSRYAAPLS
jgi:hydroxymethylpyrimidine pyrophosphatase-like HAD family hydrolase/energy-coupling factor transporter ATP-binding protein EcfA2